MYESSKTLDWRVLHWSAPSRDMQKKTNSTRIRIVWHGEKVNGANFPEVIPQECSPGVARPLILRITITGAFLALNCENQPHAFGT
jgi:hypothetical protein